MKTIILTAFLFLASASIIFGQESRLVMTRKSNGKEYFVKQGSPVKIHLDNHTSVKGPCKMIGNTTIAVGIDTILVEKIYSVSTRVEKRKKAGTKLAIIGSAGLLLGIALYSDASSGSSGGSFSIDFSAEEEKAGVGFMTLGAGVFTYGILKLTTKKVYQRNNWKFSVRRTSGILE